MKAFSRFIFHRFRKLSLESELFGHIEGSFTGAIRDHKGVFRIAGDQGSVFLDEIGDVPESVQVKLLRVLQSGEYQPIGGERKITTREKLLRQPTVI